MVRLPRRKSDALVPTGLSINPEPKTGVAGKHNQFPRFDGKSTPVL